MTEDEEVHVFLNPLLPLIHKLELEFNDLWVLREALTHRSFCNEYDGEREMRHYERLELLGDAVIGLIVKEGLLYELRDATEGDITRIYAHLAANENFGQIALQFDLGRYVLMSNGSREEHLEDSLQLNADVLEALIGAIYVDQGLKAARLYVDAFIMKHVRKLARSELRDVVQLLQELAQKSYRITPRYEDSRVGGDDHAPKWQSVVRLNDRELARGEGPSRKQSRRAAAQNALNTHFSRQRST